MKISKLENFLFLKNDLPGHPTNDRPTAMSIDIASLFIQINSVFFALVPEKNDLPLKPFSVELEVITRSLRFGSDITKKKLCVLKI